MAKKKKPSKYNIFVGKRMKAGDTLSQAAKAWNKQKSGSKKKPAKRKTSKKKTTSRKQTTRRPRRRPRGQKTLFPLINKILFSGGPVRSKIGGIVRSVRR